MIVHNLLTIGGRLEAKAERGHRCQCTALLCKSKMREVAAISEPAPELDAEDALRGVVSQLYINGERMTVIVPGSVIEALGAFSGLLRQAQEAGYLPPLLLQVMPWAAPLPADDLDQLASDLAEAAGSGSHAPERLAAALREWQATAEAYADPDILAALTTTPADCGPVAEPAG